MKLNVLKDILNELAHLKKEHNLKIGITTTGTNQVEVIQKALTVFVDGEQLFDVFQVTYNFLDQSLLEIIEELQHQNKSIVIKEALANGRIFRNENYPHYQKMYTALEDLALKYTEPEVYKDISLKFRMRMITWLSYRRKNLVI